MPVFQLAFDEALEIGDAIFANDKSLWVRFPLL